MQWERVRAVEGRGSLPDVDDLQAIFDLLGQILDVLAVLCREEHSLDPGSERADELLLDTSDSGDLATERYLALFSATFARVSVTQAKPLWEEDGETIGRKNGKGCNIPSSPS